MYEGTQGLFSRAFRVCCRPHLHDSYKKNAQAKQPSFMFVKTSFIFNF